MADDEKPTRVGNRPTPEPWPTTTAMPHEILKQNTALQEEIKELRAENVKLKKQLSVWTRGIKTARHALQIARHQLKELEP